MNVNCHKLLADLSGLPTDLAWTELPADIKQRVLTHCGDCAECRDLLLLGAYAQEDEDAGADAATRITPAGLSAAKQRILSQIEPVMLRRRRSAAWNRMRVMIRPAISAVAACLVVGALLWPIVSDRLWPKARTPLLAMEPSGYAASIDAPFSPLPKSWASIPDGAWIRFDPIPTENRYFLYFDGSKSAQVYPLAILRDAGWKLRVRGPRYVGFAAFESQVGLDEKAREGLATAVSLVLPAPQSDSAALPDGVLLALADSKAAPYTVFTETRGPADPDTKPGWVPGLERVLQEREIRASGWIYGIRK